MSSVFHRPKHGIKFQTEVIHMELQDSNGIVEREYDVVYMRDVESGVAAYADTRSGCLATIMESCFHDLSRQLAAKKQLVVKRSADNFSHLLGDDT